MSQTSATLMRASFVVIALSLANKVTGYIKLILSTAAFGTSAGADALAAATQIPDVFFVLIAGGALSSALMPVYSEILLSQKNEYRLRFIGTLFTVVIAITTVACIILAIFSPWLTRTLLVPNFSPEQQIATAHLMRINLVSLSIFGVASMLTTLIHAHKHFFYPALASVFLDSGYIVGLYFWSDSLGIDSMAWGGFLGVLFFTLVLLPPLWRFRIYFTPQLDLEMPEIREVFRLLTPRLIVLGATELVDVINVNLSYGLNEGSLSAFFFALLLINMPINLFGTSFLITFFPTLSDQFNLDNIDGLHKSVTKGLLHILFWIVPSFVGLIALGRPGIAFLMERGEFTADSTALVYSLIVIAAVGAIAQSTMSLATTLYFARHNTVVPMWFELGGMGLTVILSLWLVRPYAIQGIALARSIAALLAIIALIIAYQVTYGELPLRQLGIGLIRVLGAAAVMAVAIMALRQLTLTGLSYIVVAISIGGGVYVTTHYLAGGRELVEFIQGVLGHEADSVETL